MQVAKLTNSSTEDYGLAIDGQGNACWHFSTRDATPTIQQVTAAKMSPTGQPLWGPLGIPLTFGSGFAQCPESHGHQRRLHRRGLDLEQRHHAAEASSQWIADVDGKTPL